MVGVLEPRFTHPLCLAERAASSGQLDSLGTKQVGDKGQPSNYCLRQAQKGNLDSLAWHEDDMPELGNEKNLVVEVNYVGINFKDTLLLLGVLDQDAFADGGSKAVIGLECAGNGMSRKWWKS